MTYPPAEVEISVSGRVLTVEAGVSRTLPASVLLGTDVPELMKLLHEAQEGVVQAKELKADEVMAVTTRAQTRRQIAEEEEQEQKEAATGIQPQEILQELEEEVGEESGDGARTDGESVLGATFDQELFGDSKQRESQREVRIECRDGNMLRTKELMSGNRN